tara:strand:+ start:1025 stop:1837 length:813 start_codon:yes stop_codon:yes gene_type:complete
MSFLNKNPHLIKEVIEISEHAGKSILEIYNNSNLDFQLKEDQSPLTEADISSHKIIVKRLRKLTPKLPILSEEESYIPFSVRSKWDQYWLIDPLDGTKEFIKKNGEFTVNIALMKNNAPVFGVINIPVKKQTYWGSEDLGSYLQKDNHKPERINVDDKNNEKIRILTSRSHGGNEDLILTKIKNYEVIMAGSSLKFCLIASGEADAYIRMGPTSEWDIAAGEAIIKCAGGIMIDLQHKNIAYNKGESLINPPFLVASNQSVANKILNIIN